MRSCWKIAALGLVLLVGCNADGNAAILADAASGAQAVSAVKAVFQSRFDAFADATAAMCAAAPAADADGWNAKSDAAAVAAMRASWLKARAAYSGVEAAARASFPAIDARVDTDYDDMVAAGADTFLFDEHGVRGLQAMERILWSDVIPPAVLAHESALEGYYVAAFPATEHEADELKSELCGDLAADAAALRDGFRALDLDPVTAFAAAKGSLDDQLGQLEEAAKGEGKSRYADRSLADLRDGLAGTEATYAAFRPWILSKTGGAHTDEEVTAAFARLKQAYATPTGDALPAPPDHWLGDEPTDEMAATPFGTLFAAGHDEAQAEIDGTLCFEILEAGGLLGLVSGS